ncbi:MAG: hypothetical protein VB861_04245 [Planctomycetaceae bacterium]|jgi:hypothetical protein|nr:hypothetical protein [Roseibacillus sp.]|tara:strand:+ start:10094 stop:10231 length:138 start_codon:yes stop_codon:yes gene_type:complete
MKTQFFKGSALAGTGLVLAGDPSCVRGQDAVLHKLDAWQMKPIWP